MLSKDTLNKQLISRRTFIIGVGKFAMLFLLSCRMFYMQFIKKDEYRTLSDKNRIKIIIIPPIRGQIFDRENNIIVKNKTCFNLLLDKNKFSRSNKELDFIANILELDAEHLERINKRIKKGSRRIPVIVIDCLDWRELSAIEERRAELDAISIKTGYTRIYKNGANSAHILGYLGMNTDNNKKQNHITQEILKVGKSGIEKYYENGLNGEFGYKQIEVNAYGRYVRDLNKNDSISGNDLHLNIDSTLQEKIMPILPEKGCSAVVMDCTNGQILAMNSSPTFQPNNFNNLSQKYWNSLINNPYKPLINKTIQSLYPPGSPFKIIVILAALEAGLNPNDRYVCKGNPMIGNSFRCASRFGHGALNMIEAIKTSCNIYIYEIAKIIGADKIIAMAKRFGLGQITGIDLPGELSGFVPTKEWKKNKFGTKWTIGDTFNLSLGQGFLLVTPLQLTRMIAAIANNGKLFKPQIAKAEPEFTTIDIKQEYLDILKTGLYQTVNNLGGTSYRNRINYKSIKMAGKTGTAQVISKLNANDDLNRADIAWNRRNHAIFLGFAPFKQPKFAISVYFDHGGGGGKNATPIAKKIMQEILYKYF
ncbi:MAG: penicillin-binding protein 2 [Rickettsiaceae bacterium]|nr:penicillin-binding protein 2 [Rickettsiaceae bacterium]